MSALTACHLGATPYRESLALQESLVRARAAGRTGDWLLFPDHPPVLTVGRGARPGSLRAAPDVLARLGLEVFEVARGGDVTWHGPGQLVGYAICDLSKRGRDLRRFLRDLESALVAAVESYGVQAHTVPGRTGVWVGERKLGSIGIAVRSWVSYHGFALNVAPDLKFFDLIHPCGLHGVRMTSLAALMRSAAPTLAEARRRIASSVAESLGSRSLGWAPAEDAWAAAGLAPPPARLPVAAEAGESAA